MSNTAPLQLQSNFARGVHKETFGQEDNRSAANDVLNIKLGKLNLSGPQTLDQLEARYNDYLEGTNSQDVRNATEFANNLIQGINDYQANNDNDELTPQEQLQGGTKDVAWKNGKLSLSFPAHNDLTKTVEALADLDTQLDKNDHGVEPTVRTDLKAARLGVETLLLKAAESLR